MKFLVSGGRNSRILDLLGKGHISIKAELIEIDFNNKRFRSLISLNKNDKYYPKKNGTISFRCFCTEGDKIYLATNTQILIYSREFEFINEINHPWFNDIHSVCLLNDELVIVITGLDLVMFFTPTGEYKRYQSVIEQDCFNRFGKNLDFRKISSTKPHYSHPNFAFSLDDDIWITRFIQKDAVNLYNQNEKMDLSNYINCGIHDGHKENGWVYFTSVDGNIIKVNSSNKKVVEVINLNKIENSSSPLGWCRGLYIENEIAYVCYSKLRSTKIKENLLWLKNKQFSKPSNILPARIVKYDMAKKSKLDEFIFPDNLINLVFYITPLL